MERRITTYEQAIEFLYARINYERAQTGSYSASDFKLDRMKQLLARLGNPHDSIPAVHIAGTKGKGTTAAMVARILEEAGFRTGLFTSPHISSFEERVQVNGRMPSRADVVSLVRRVAQVSDEMDQVPGQMSPTFFEITMAIGWLWFQKQAVDLAVLEVGLGGRLDATNLCRPVATAITSISRDHTGLLGSTLNQIAEEKAGIIKPGIPVVTGVEDPGAFQTIEQIARKAGASLFSIDRDMEIGQLPTSDPGGLGEVTVKMPGKRYSQLRVPFAGKHQIRNAALAAGLVATLEQQGWPIGEEAVRKGLAEARCPLRIEVLQRNPAVVLDVAHNWASVRALLETLDSDFSANRSILIFAASRDKDVSGMLRLLLPRFSSVIVTQFQGNPRGLPVEKTAKLARSLSSRFVHSADTPAQAWQLAKRLAGPDDLICGTGSFFIAAELREVILGDGPAPAAGDGEARRLPLSHEKGRQHGS